VAWVAAVSGNSIGYWIGMQGGRRLILRYGRYFGVGETQLRRMENSFSRYGVWFITFARFFEVLRQLNGVVAGTSGMPRGKFLLSNLAGAALWTCVWGLGSWRLGRNIHGYEDMFEKTGMIFVLLGALALLVALAIVLRHRRQRRDRDTGGDG
jgi:membrane protein DedA with SNARE-associated domain